MHAATARAGRVRAILETLRAPLLLSPTADVLAGYAVTRAARPEAETAGALGLLCAAAAGSCLLAAGMAQNALVDREDDRLRKPQRPIPRGALDVATVAGLFALLTLAGLAAAAAVPGAWPTALAIGLLSALYHYLAKRWRLPGCLLLGCLRGLDMSLGVLAAGGALTFEVLPDPAGGIGATHACLLYALYMGCASLHASTDDERGARGWSRAGLGGAALILLWLAALALRAGAPLGALCAAWALLRLLAAWRRLPPGPLTGVALSNLYMSDAALAFAAAGWWAGAGCLLLFAVSRLLLKRFPPT